MKRLVVLFVAAMLYAAPAMAANSVVYKGAQGGQGAAQGSMEKVVNQTTFTGSTAVNNGTNNVMGVGNITNKGKMKEVINQTTVKGSQTINNGTGNAMDLGGISNE